MTYLKDHFTEGTVPEGQTPEDMLGVLRQGVVFYAVIILVVMAILAFVSLGATLVAGGVGLLVEGVMTLTARHFGKPYREMIKARDNG